MTTLGDRSPLAFGFNDGGLSDRCCGPVSGVAGFANVDAALEVRAVFDGDSCGCHISGQRAFAADVDAVAGVDVAAHLAQHYDLAGHDVGCDRAIAADGDTVARKVDRALYLAVDEERFRSRDLALDDEGLADGGLLAGRDRR